MKKKFLLFTLTAALLCGCDKQTKINSEKIQRLSQNILQFEQNQSKQMAAIQSQLTALAPMLDRMNSSYFEKNHDAEFFYHTNTLYLLLMVDNKIEAHLQLADKERAAQNAQAFMNHTNELGALYLTTAQILDALAGLESRQEDQLTNQQSQILEALAGQENRLAEKVNDETRRVGTGVNEALLKQIKLSAVPDAAEIARRRSLEADVAQMKHELEQIKTQLAQIHDATIPKPAVPAQ
jgi:hypothetical protein